MGWFIAQSLAFIIIAALIGLAIGIWIGWLVWGRHANGKHTAEKAAAARTAAAPASDAETEAPAAGTGAETVAEEDKADAESVPALAVTSADAEAKAGTETPDAASDADASAVLPVADSTPAPGTDDKTGAGTAVDDGADDAGAGEEEVEAAGSDVVAEAEAVVRKAAESTEAAEAAEPAETAEAAAPSEATAPDDLRRIEGIGPKIASALVAAGYPTYAKIAAATEDELREAVASQGIKFAPSAATWADQAQYLVDHDADGLEEYQDYLVGGQERRAKFKETVDYTDVDEIDGAEAKAAAIAEDEAEAAAAAEPEPEPEPEDLRRIEGIGPKIEAALLAAGYTTYAKVAGASETDLREALAASGIKFAPAATSWADQAQYLVDGDESGFQEYQDYLVGGQDRAAKFKEDVDYTDVDEIEDTGAKAAAISADETKAAAAGGDAGPGVKA